MAAPMILDTNKAEKSRQIKFRLLENTEKSNALTHVQANETDCLALWTAIENYSFSIAFTEYSTEAIPSIPACKKIPGPIRQVHQNLETACAPFMGKQKAEIPKEQRDDLYSCQTLLLFYRGAIRDWATRDVNVQTSTDLRLLMDKLLSAISQSNPSAIEKVAERMHELEPNFYEPIKALVIAKIISVVSIADERQKSEAFLRLERQLQEAKDFGIYDPELIQAEVILKSRGFQDYDAVKLEGQRIANEFPERGLGDYAISSALYHQKNFDGAREHLLLAIKKEPGNQQFKATLKELEANPGNPDLKIYKISMGFRLNFNDQNDAVLQQERQNR